METLLKIGVAGATPFVLQFLMDFIKNGNTQEISLRTKMILSVATGSVLALLLQLYVMSRPVDPNDFTTVVLIPNALGWFFIVLNGAIEGAVATGAIAIGYKIAEKISSPAEEQIINVHAADIRE